MSYVPRLEELEAAIDLKIAKLRAEKQRQPFTPEMASGEGLPPTQPTTPPIMPPVTGATAFIPPPPTETPQVLPTRAELEQKTYEWWEKPAEATQTLMQKFGEGVSQVPLVGEALEWAAPGLEWVHEKVEKPWAAGLLSGLSPSLAPMEGESWIDREKREYEAWDAPTYVKGAAEFAMPLWWLPWVGWAGKGLKAVGIGAKAAKTIKAMSASEVIVPTISEFVSKVKPSMLRSAAGKVENIPALGKTVKALGGEQMFLKPEGVARTALDKTRDALLYERSLLDQIGNVVRVQMNRPFAYLAKKGVDQKNLLQIKDNIVGAVTTDAKHGGVVVNGKVSYLLDDVITNVDKYVWKNPEARKFMDEIIDTAKYFEGVAIANGVRLPKRQANILDYLPRIVKEIERGGEKFTMQGKTNPFKELVYQTAEEGAEAGVRYTDDVIARLQLFGEAVTKRIATTKFDDAMQKVGRKTGKDYVEEMFPELYASFVKSRTMTETLKDLSKRMSIAGGVRASKILHGSQLNKLRDMGYGELADRIASAQVMPTRTIADVARSITMHSDLISKGKNVVKDYIYTYGKTMSRKESVEALTKVTGKRELSEYIVDNVYRDTLKMDMKQNWGKGLVDVKITSNADRLRKINDKALKGLREEVDDLAKANADELAPQKAWYDAALKDSKLAHLPNEAKFRTHPAFGKTIFPKEVVDFLQPIMEDTGVEWMRGLQKLSGASRMLIASLDLSAGLIQGLNLFGRNPVAWGKSMGQMFKIAKDPQYMYKYFEKIHDLRMDRVMHGGSTAAMDYFDALPLVRKAIGKYAGKKGERVVGETYGRAEAAFLGFGEIARSEMWKVGRGMYDDMVSKGKITKEVADGLLDDWARSVDRMTGVISPDKLGLGRTQQQIENTWMFFAPRYTRAGFAFMGDLMKGGVAGDMARKAISGYMLGGFTMYAGVMAALGQEPNFNPNSAKFMTAKIGEHRVGLGGFTYGFMRMLAGVTQSAIEEPKSLSPLNLSRTDNPFYKFMFNRTSPLTSTIAGFMEQENFLGEPFESPADWAKFMAEKVTPIAAQSVLGDEGFHPAVLGAEILGGRTYPKSTWEVRDEYRERGAQELYAKEWKDLTRAEQRDIENDSEVLMELDEEIKEKNILRGDPEQLRRNEWLDDIDKTKIERDRLINIAADMAAADGDYHNFKERISDIDNDYAAVLGHISEKYKTIIDDLSEPNLKDMTYLDATYNIWTQRRYAPDMENELGEPDWAKVEKLREDFEREYGEEALAYAEEDRVIAGRDLPEIYLELRKARKLLRPYWKVRSDYEKLFGVPRNSYQLRMMDKVVGAQRKSMLSLNPVLARYYEMFYRRTT